jgi:hypothetical protein
MQAAALGFLVLGVLSALAGLLMCLVPARRKIGGRAFLLGILVAFVASVVGASHADQQAKAAGFEGFSDMRAAEEAGIADPEEWAVRREGVLEEQRRAKEEKERREEDERRLAEAQEARAEWEIRAELDVPLQEVNKRYNDVVRSLNGALRMPPGECHSGVRHACAFSISQSLGVIAAADTAEDNVHEVGVIYNEPNATDEGAAEATASFGIMMMIFSPELSQSGRRQLMDALVEGTVDEGEHEEVVGDVTYTMRRVPGEGLWFIVTPTEG